MIKKHILNYQCNNIVYTDIRCGHIGIAIYALYIGGSVV